MSVLVFRLHPTGLLSEEPSSLPPHSDAGGRDTLHDTLTEGGPDGVLHHDTPKESEMVFSEASNDGFVTCKLAYQNRLKWIKFH